MHVERRLKLTLDMIISKKKRIALELDRRNKCTETNMMRFWSIFSSAVNRTESESKYIYIIIYNLLYTKNYN